MPVNGKLAWLAIVVSVLLLILLKKNSRNEDELKEWLVSNGIGEFHKPLKHIGIDNVQAVLEMDSDQLNMLQSFLNKMDLDIKTNKLMTTIGANLLAKWLEKRHLSYHVLHALQSEGVYTLEQLRRLSKKRLDAVVVLIQTEKEQKLFKESVNELYDPLPTVTYRGLVVLLYLVLIMIFLVTLYVFCAKLVLLFAALCVRAILFILANIFGTIFKEFFQKLTGRNLNYPTPNFGRFLSTSARNSQRSTENNRLSGEFKLGLYDRILGKTLDIRKSEVTWKHSSNGLMVGGSSVITVKFHCKNESPYKLQHSDNLHVNIIHVSSRTTLPHVIEPSSIVGSSLVKVSFTTRLSGDYSISIKLNGIKVSSDGVIIKNFKPGPVDSEKTVFLQQSNTIVVTSGLYHSMEIVPKDSFGNAAIITQTFLTAEIRKGGPNGEIINSECVVDRGGGENRYEILLKVESPGYFVGYVKYKNSVIGPPSINIISLSESNSATVDKNVAKKCNVYYEAQMHPCTATGGNNKSKRVYCYPSSKQLQIKEYYLLGIIPKRLYTCKVCPQTRILFNENDEESFIVDDGYQSPVVLSSPHREVLAATFYKFLLKNIGGSEKFHDKRTFFYAEVKKLKNYRIRGEISFTVERDNILDNFMSATKNLSTSDWYKKFSITFKGEEGLDWGGVSRELFQLLCVRCFDPTYHLFKRFADNPQSLVHPNHKRPPHLKLKHYEFAGRVVGKCLYESAVGQPLMVKARFTRSFLAQIIGLRINHKYFESDIPELYTTKIQYIRDNDVSDLGLAFAEEEFDTADGTPKVVPLIDKGEDIDVNNTNKSQYLNLLAQYKLAKCVREEIESFLKGLNDIIPEHLLSIFDETELELLMCGIETVSYSDLKIHAVVSGSTDGFKEVVEWFWNVVSGFTQEEMAKLIQFVTGCSQLPPGGFRDLHPPFQIISSPTHGRLPTAHTCFNQICLPSYDSFEQFQQSLTLAIHEGSEGFGFA